MDVRDIPSEVDLKLNLLYGDELITDKLKVKPLTVRDVMKMGYHNYSKYISILTIDKKSVTDDNPIYDDVSLIDIIIQSNSDVLVESFAYAMAAFLNEEIKDLLIDESVGFVFGGRDFDKDAKSCNVVDGSNFNDFVQIIKYQNCLIGTSEQYLSRPANEKAQRILDKIKKNKEVIEKVKASARKDENDIDFADIVSAVSTKSNTINKINVWDLTMYQLYDEYKRLEAISSYETNIAAMLQGVKVDDLKHWSAKID